MENSLKWSSKDVMDILSNPIYAFGVLLEPQEEALNWMRALNRSLPNPFWRWPLNQQEQLYKMYFKWLDQNHFVEISNSNIPPIISVNEWIKAQKKLREELVVLPEDWTFIKKQVKEFLESVKE